MSIYKVAFTISFNSNAIVKAEHNFFYTIYMLET